MHDKISPTAKLVAHWRRFSDIPFSKDIAEIFEVEAVLSSVFKLPKAQFLDTLLAPMLEIRYKCIQNIILQHEFKQVLEFASGISLRGLAMTKDPALTYVETDLAALNQEKTDLVSIIMKKHAITKRPNLFFHPVNILDKEASRPALEHFDSTKPLAIIHEGLFQYLNHDEKARAAAHIHNILKRFGGLWITPDLEIKKDDNDREEFRPILQAITEATGRSFFDNAFEDEDNLYSFFNKLGFSVEKLSQFSDDKMLSSFSATSLSPKIYHMLKSLNLWVLRCED